MGNGTKVALVALLILMVVMIARFVRDDSGSSDGAAVSRAAGDRAATGGLSDRAARTTPQSGPGQGYVQSVTDSRGTKQPGKAGQLAGQLAGQPAPNEPAKGLAQRPPSGGVNSGSQVNTGNGSPPRAGSAGLDGGAGGGAAGGAAVQAGGTAAPGLAKQTSSTPSTPPNRIYSDVQSKVGGDAPGEFHPIQLAKDASSPTPGGTRFPPNPISSSPGSPSGSGATGSGLAGSGPGGGVNLGSKERVPPAWEGADRESKASGDSTLPGRSLPGAVARGEKTSSSLQGAQAPAKQDGLKHEGPAAPLERRLEKPGEKTESSSGYPKTYVVEKGDSYWRIADNFYKNGRLGTLIEKANPGIKLQPGKKLLIPEPPSSEGKEAKVPAVTAAFVAPALSDGGVAGAGSGVRRHSRSSADAPSGAPPSSPSSAAKGYKDYVVQKGDTLSLIAKKFYDDPNKFHLIEDANGDLKYQVLQAGAKIKVPIEK